MIWPQPNSMANYFSWRQTGYTKIEIDMMIRSWIELNMKTIKTLMQLIFIELLDIIVDLVIIYSLWCISICIMFFFKRLCVSFSNSSVYLWWFLVASNHLRYCNMQIFFAHRRMLVVGMQWTLNTAYSYCTFYQYEKIILNNGPFWCNAQGNMLLLAVLEYYLT